MGIPGRSAMQVELAHQYTAARRAGDATSCLPKGNTLPLGPVPVEVQPPLLYACRHVAEPPANGRRRRFTGENNTMNPLETITGTLIAGLVLSVLLVFVVKALAGV
jgi:hypothetical protein